MQTANPGRVSSIVLCSKEMELVNRKGWEVRFFLQPCRRHGVIWYPVTDAEGEDRGIKPLVELLKAQMVELDKPVCLIS